jgi:hypothetical protein
MRRKGGKTLGTWAPVPEHRRRPPHDASTGRAGHLSAARRADATAVANALARFGFPGEATPCRSFVRVTDGIRTRDLPSTTAFERMPVPPNGPSARHGCLGDPKHVADEAFVTNPLPRTRWPSAAVVRGVPLNAAPPARSDIERRSEALTGVKRMFSRMFSSRNRRRSSRSCSLIVRHRGLGDYGLGQRLVVLAGSLSASGT